MLIYYLAAAVIVGALALVEFVVARQDAEGEWVWNRDDQAWRWEE